jgi:hypothetical protein
MSLLQIGTSTSGNSRKSKLKWHLTDVLCRNVNISNIGAGFLYNSPTAMKVRADVTFGLNIGTSIFDYTNISADGLVSNILYTFSPSLASSPNIFSEYVNPGFPLFTQDILQVNGAVFTGLVESPKNGQVASVSTTLSVIGFAVLLLNPVVLSIPECDSSNSLFDQLQHSRWVRFLCS